MADSISTVMTDLYHWLRGLRVRPGDVDKGPPSVPVPRGTLTYETVESIRRTLDEHDTGQFLRSGLLAQLIRRDADCFGALQQRLTIGAGIAIHAESEDEALEADLCMQMPQILTAGASADMRGDAVQLGYAVGQVWWREDDDWGLLPVVDPWPPSAVEFRVLQRQWYVHTQDQGPVPITPGDGQWIVHTPWSKREPWMWGTLRSTAIWHLRNEDAAADASRHAEVHGIPVWKAKLPAGARQTPDGKAFARSLRTMGRNAVVPLPQGDTAARSYDVELIEAKTDAYRIFEFLRGVGGRAFRLAILGQDMTSAHDGVGTYASSQTGREITGDLGLADVTSLAETLTHQLVPHVVRFRRGPGARASLRAIATENTKALADTWTAAGSALTALRNGGVDVDTASFAARFGIPLNPTPPAKP